MKKVLIMAGGTGGHVFPALAVAQAMQKQGVAVYWLGTARGLENEVVPRFNIDLQHIQISGLRGHGWRKWLIAPFALLRAIFQAKKMIKTVNPDIVLGMGGFVSGPGGIAAKLLRKPLVIQEQNAIAGLTNRSLAWLADISFQAFPQTFSKLHRHVITVGNPIRPEISNIAAPQVRWQNRQGRLRILVLGGSLGAKVINQTVPNALAMLDKQDRPEVRHQAGRAGEEETRHLYQMLGLQAQIDAFIDDMAGAYAWADIVICRAGALTVSELAAAGIGSILIPYPHSVDLHQVRNAEYLAREKAAIIMLQEHFTAPRLAQTLQQFAHKRADLLGMAIAARNLYQGDATQKVITHCLNLVNNKREAAMIVATAIPDISNLKNIHFVGIGGAGMSGIAEVFATQGFKVSGSDIAESAITQHLQKLGATIFLGHAADNIKNAEVLVYSSIIDATNPEIIAAKQANIPIVPRAQMLAQLMKTRYGVAVAGTHGKTTTTSLTATVLAEGGLDPTFVIGGLLRSAGTNAHLGASDYLVAEADESDASFLLLAPKIIIVTNIDADHLGTYNNDFAVLKAAFIQFIHLLPEDGLAVLCSDDPVIRELLPQIKRPYVTYGFNETDYVRAVSYQQNETRCNIKVKYAGKTDFDITLNLPGRHNVLNALAAIAVAKHLGVKDDAIATGLEKFQGAGRRFQMYGELDFGKGNALIVDDYGHHPREIAATLAAARAAWPQRRLVLAFQPHRYTRTHDLFNDFVDILSIPDALVLLDIYSAGEKPIPGITGKALCDAIIAAGKVNSVVFVEKAVQLPDTLKNILQEGDILLLQGAGDIGKIAPKLAESAKKPA